ncbi:MAG: hypothetical protein LUH23_09485 [Oscillospiraceae bacterium]|nr:hypothetical protein [Oscillospiraceae bacterium]
MEKEVVHVDDGATQLLTELFGKSGFAGRTSAVDGNQYMFVQGLLLIHVVYYFCRFCGHFDP